MRIKVSKQDALSALQESEIGYRVRREHAAEKYERDLENTGTADIPPPDRSDEFELYKKMLNEHREAYVWLDGHDFELIFGGEL